MATRERDWSGWMVQYTGRGGAVTLQFAESAGEAERVVAHLKANGYKATYWQLG